MAAPTRWNAPSSGGSLSGALTVNYVSYASGYWFALTVNGSSQIALRVATDPTGTWSTATLPAAPTGYTTSSSAEVTAGVVSDGTTWAFIASYSNGSATKYRVIYATTPSGTWSSHEFDTTDLYQPSWIAYHASTWIIAGRYLTTSPQPGFIATSSTANGTYTFNTSAATTGYDTADLSGGGTQFWDIKSLDYDGSTYVSTANRNTGTSGIRYSSALTSAWAAPSSPPSTNFTGSGYIRYHVNGWWTVNGSSNVLHYTNTPSGTWTELAAADMGLTSNFGQIAHTGTYWVACGAYDEAVSDQDVRISYLLSATSPAGTYTTVDGAGFTDPAFTDTIALWIDYGADGYLVVASNYDGELRYSYSPAGPTLLRQRQSPLRTPARVRGVDLRQRQTPFIT